MSDHPACTLSTTLPDPIEVGGGTVVYVDGFLGATEPGRPVALRLGPVEQKLLASGLPETGSRGRGRRFAGFVDLPAGTPTGEVELVLVVETDSVTKPLHLARTTIVTRSAKPAPPPPSVIGGDGTLIAIAMATWEPDRERFREQLESLRAQSWPNWICVISDDASSAEAFAGLRAVVGADDRFVISRSEDRRGFYFNFERAIRMAPAEASLIALCDQDDRWDADKLEALAATLAANPRASLAYSDNRIRLDDGAAGFDSAFTERRNSYDDIASLLVANTVTGAASIFRRELLEVALPFPPAPGVPYHDHWLALCALASGEIAYLDRPTYDRIRHLDSVTMLARGGRGGPPGRQERRRARLQKLRSARGAAGWRPFYFNRYLRIAHFARVLELRLGDRIAVKKRRAIHRLIAADRSFGPVIWLALRSLRPWLGRDETFGIERNLVAGVLWKRLASRRGR